MKLAGQYAAFVSYASESREKANQLCASLEARGLVCWMAPRDVRAGREYADEIILGLEHSAAVVLVLSAAANTSVFVLREIERAVAKEINVVPVRIEEVSPSPGLELFISGTHWLDVWEGDWDEHMDRLVRDLSDSPPGPAMVHASVEHHAATPHRSLRTAYVAAALALVVTLSGVALWSFSRDTSPQAEPAVRPEAGPPTDVADSPPVTNPPPVAASVAPSVAPSVTPSVGSSVESPSRETRGTTAPRPREPNSGQSSPQTPRQAAPSAPGATGTAPAAPAASSALNALRDDYDNLSLRGSVIDEALNQLWEEMKPNSPRIDMVTRQRSLKTNLTRSRDALADRDVAEARRYLDGARADLAALEQFLNR
jgi:hypothetical protein